MLCRAALTGLRRAAAVQARRNFGVSAVASAQLDPIQQLFVDKIREYSQKSKSAGGKLVDATPDLEKSLKDQLDKVDRMYSAQGKDMTQFPTFNFTDPTLQPVGLGQSGDEAAVVETKSSQVDEEVDDEENRPYFDV